VKVRVDLLFAILSSTFTDVSPKPQTDALTAKAAALSLTAASALEADTAKKEKKAAAKEDAEVKRKMASRVTIKRVERNKKKYVTAVMGLEAFGEPPSRNPSALYIPIDEEIVLKVSISRRRPNSLRPNSLQGRLSRRMHQGPRKLWFKGTSRMRLWKCLRGMLVC
jgi:hypothetical protein